MKGQRPIKTVADLMAYLGTCSPDAEISLRPEDGDGFQIGGVLEFSAQQPNEVWILIDEFTEYDRSNSPVMKWGAGDDDEENPDVDSEDAERPGDMCQLTEDFNTRVKAAAERHAERKEIDVVAIRGNMREA